MYAKMTFIREWTDPENSMHPGLGRERLGAGTSSASQRSQCRKSPAVGAGCLQEPEAKKAAITPASPGRGRLQISGKSSFARTRTMAGPRDWAKPNRSRSVVFLGVLPVLPIACYPIPYRRKLCQSPFSARVYENGQSDAVGSQAHGGSGVLARRACCTSAPER